MKLAVRRAFVNTLAQCILSPQKAPQARPLSKTAGLRNCSEVAFHAGPALLYAQGHELKTVRLTAHPAKQGNARSRQCLRPLDPFRQRVAVPSGASGTRQDLSEDHPKSGVPTLFLRPYFTSSRLERRCGASGLRRPWKKRGPSPPERDGFYTLSWGLG